MSWTPVSLFTNVTREPAATVTDRGDAPADVIVIVAPAEGVVVGVAVGVGALEGLEFLYFGDEAGMGSWCDAVRASGPDKRFAVKGNFLEAKSYGSVLQQYWQTHGAARRSDIPERFVDDLLRQPYLETAAKRGWTFDPAKYARSTGRSAGEAVAVIPGAR